MLNVQGLLQLLRVGIVQTPEGDYRRIRQLLELLLLITLDEVLGNVCHGYLFLAGRFAYRRDYKGPSSLGAQNPLARAGW